MTIFKKHCGCKNKNPVFAEDVIWCSKKYLDRIPNDQEELENHLSSSCCWKALVNRFTDSKEFRIRIKGYHNSELQPDLFYFYHIYKTGGYSVHDYLESVLPEGSMYPSFHLSDINYSDCIGKYKYLSGHFGALPVFEGKRRTIKIATLFREPIARGISHYKHVKRDSLAALHNVVNEYTTKEFIKSRYAPAIFGNIQSIHMLEINRNAKRFLPYGTLRLNNTEILELAIDALDQLDIFGVTEKHHDFLMRLSEKWQLPIPAKDFLSNTAQKTQNENFDSEDLNTIKELCREDLVLYSKVLELL